MTDTALQARIALAEIEAMGLTIDDLLAVAGRQVLPALGVPTVAEYVPVVAAGYQPRTRRTYNSYWSLLVEMVGDKALDAITVEDLLAIADEATSRARIRRPGSEQRGASAQKSLRTRRAPTLETLGRSVGDRTTRGARWLAEVMGADPTR